MSKKTMELNDDEYQKYLVWRLEQLYQLDGDSPVEKIQELKDTISNQLDKEQLRLDRAIDQIEDMVKHKQSAYKEAVKFAVKKTLEHFPEHEGKNTRIITVDGHGDFKIDLDTGEFLGGKKYLYEDWVEGKIFEPEKPKPGKIKPLRLATLIIFGVTLLGLTTATIITTYQAITFSWAEVTSTGEYRFAKPGQRGYKPYQQRESNEKF